MTIVTATLQGPDYGAGPTPARGYLRFTPTRGITTEEDPTLPMTKTVKLSVEGTASVTLEPSGPGWAWAVTTQVLGYAHTTTFYAVPNTTTVDLDNLVEVDIQTLIPVDAVPDPGWYAYVDSIVAGQIGSVAVVTGNELRPAYGTVLWIGGVTQPVNMLGNTDIWFKSIA